MLFLLDIFNITVIILTEADDLCSSRYSVFHPFLFKRLILLYFSTNLIFLFLISPIKNCLHSLLVYGQNHNFLGWMYFKIIFSRIRSTV